MKTLKEVVPQDGVLYPALFLFFMNNIHKSWKPSLALNLWKKGHQTPNLSR
ncbi:hypothetical protein DPMN_062311 [Dreissena polymorpha]|uniref:Uncharacterized protein n=1 Tax=Dreissena polymorpha TaxID=45954 RepID=A0A9D4C9N4_DREPO|nr:hypothetical protein DPMN_062311 [Dreissena polymorpha]